MSAAFASPTSAAAHPVPAGATATSPPPGPITPGPWVVLHKNGIFPEGNTSLAIGTAERHREGWEANARLMAAAPAMYAALDMVRILLTHPPYDMDRTDRRLILAEVLPALASVQVPA